jgi:hypothetical protein
VLDNKKPAPVEHTDGQTGQICKGPFYLVFGQSILFYILFVFGATAPNGSGPPHSRGFYITHSDAPHSVVLVWTSGQLVAETST